MESPQLDRETLAWAHAEALQRQYAGALTEPLSLSELREYFGCCENKLRAVLGAMDGVERFGQLWRVPLWKMPPSYLQERGYLPDLRQSAGSLKIGQNRPR